MPIRSGVDVKGPVPVAVASEWGLTDGSGKKARLAVFGNATFFSNQFTTGQMGSFGNIDLALNTFGWLAEQENKISIHPKEEDNRVLNITSVSNMLMVVVVLIILPASVLLAGFLAWYRRRSL